MDSQVKGKTRSSVAFLFAKYREGFPRFNPPSFPWRLGLGLLVALSALRLAGLISIVLQAAPLDDEKPVVRVSTRLVQVNVSVETRNGQPIEGLTKDDFKLWDQGRQQTIQFFSVQSNRPLSRETVTLAPRTFSNRLEQQAEVPASVTVILLDGLNTHFDDQVFAKKQIIKFLQQIQSGDHVALYTLGANVRVLHDFTSDSQSLVAALSSFTVKESPEIKASEPAPEPVVRTVIIPNMGGAPNSGQGSVGAITVGIEDYIRQTQQQSADWYSMDRTLRTLDALKAIARRLAHLPGRKNLIWVSSSFPFTIGSGTANAENVSRGQRTFGPEIEQAERLLNDANMAIYPVDARGLVSPFAINPNISAERSVSARLSQENPSIEGLGQLTPTHDTMETLASETGGRAFYGTNDIMGSIRRALNDARLTYTLGYYPSDVEWDGKFHEIKIRVQHSGARALYRRGYFALAEIPRTSKEQTQLLREAAAEPLDATAIGLTVRTEATGEPNVLPVSVNVDLHGLNIIQKDGRWSGSVNILFAQISSAGVMVNGLTQPLHLNLTDQEYRQVLEKGLSISGNLRIVPGAEKIRVIAMDETSLVVGSVTVPLEMPQGSNGGTGHKG